MVIVVVLSNLTSIVHASTNKKKHLMHNFKFRVKTLCKINYLNLVHQINPTSLWKELQTDYWYPWSIHLHKIQNTCMQWVRKQIIWNKNITLYLYDLSYPCNIQCLLPSKHVDRPLRNPAFRVSLNNIDYLLAKRQIKQKWKNVDLMCFKVNSPAYSKPLRPHSTKNRPHSI